MGGRELIYAQEQRKENDATATDAVDVVLAVGGKVVVDDEGNLLDIDTTGEEVSGDENTGRSKTELLHDNITLSLLSMSPCPSDC